MLKPSFVITQYDRGLFSSQVLLTFKLPERCGPSKEIVLNENINHGPVPWALVKQGKFKPALAYSQAVLVENDYTHPWFKGENGAMPLRSNTTITFSQELQTRYVMTLHTLDTESSVWSTSNATLDIRWNSITKMIKVVSVIDMLRKLDKHSQPDSLTLDMKRRNGSFGFHMQGYESEALLQDNGQALFTGETLSALKSVQLLFNKTPLLTLSDYSDISISKEENHQVSTQFSANVRSIQIAPGIVLPKTYFTANAANLDWKAKRSITLSPFFNDASFVMLALCPVEFNKKTVFTKAEQQQILRSALALLSGQRKLSLSQLSIKGESAEIRIEVNASLIKPTSMSIDLSLEEIGKLLPQIIDSADARLSLSEAAMTNLIEKCLRE